MNFEYLVLCHGGEKVLRHNRRVLLNDPLDTNLIGLIYSRTLVKWDGKVNQFYERYFNSAT